jgi:signal transduction histidine kinase
MHKKTKRRGRAAQHELLRLLDHEIRSPLTVVKGWAEVVLDDVRDGVAVDERVAAELYRAADEASGLAVRLLDALSGLDARGVVITSSAFGDLVHQVRAEARVGVVRTY